MSLRKYDSSTTTFSPEGRLYQVEYAMECISHASPGVGILTKNAVILGAEKKVSSKLLDSENNSRHSDMSSEKLFKIDDHVGVAVAGLTSDGNLLINHARHVAHKHTYTYQEPCTIEQLITNLCDLKQGYTQFGGQRPFGVSFLYAGWDAYYGFQLYHSDPSGNYSAWKANAIGSNSAQAVEVLKQNWKADMTMDEGVLLGVKALSKTMDTTALTPEKLEFAVVTLQNGKPNFHILTAPELTVYLEKAKAAEQEEKEKDKQ
eukprot:TRINITY_DN94414_c0_g1_i1.p1 TRINITY_DN94414_c0_g1~~TRINITY_DN94414_c0_g1_i1.p1  ORF type:complete len:261 (-),score=51.84 TRINITY_DN94414_c0_g1_i1:21-803(-)